MEINYANFKEQILGRSASDLENLSTIGMNITSGLNESFSSFIVLQLLANLYYSYGDNSQITLNEAVPITKEEFDAVIDVARHYSTSTINATAFDKILSVRCFEENSDGCIYVVDDEGYTFQDDTSFRLYEEDGAYYCRKETQDDRPVSFKDAITEEYIGDVTTFMKQIAQGRGMSQFIAEICSVASDAYTQGQTNFIMAINSIVSKYNAIPDNIKSGVSYAVTYGPRALYEYISSFYKAFSDTVQTDPQYFNSTNIAIRTFAAGIVLQTVGAIISVASTIIFAVSRVLGAIAAIAGAVLTFLGQITSVALTEIEDTRFKINVNQSSHCFNFVVAQHTIEDSSIAQFMRNLEVASITVPSRLTASVIFIYLLNPSDSSDNHIGVEEHLSIDYDLSEIITNLGPVHPAGGNQDVLSYPNTGLSFSDLTETYMSDNSVWDAGFVALMKNAINLFPSVEDVSEESYSPIDVNLVASLKSVFTDYYQSTFYWRLVSALFIWSLAKIQPSVSKSDINWGTYNYVAPFAWAAKRNLVDERRNYVIGSAFSYACHAIYIGLTNDNKKYVGPSAVSTNDIDFVITAIQILFDGLPLQQADLPDVVSMQYLRLNDDWTRESGSPTLYTASISYGSPSGYPLGLASGSSMLYALPTLTPINLPDLLGFKQVYAHPTYLNFISSGWPTAMAVDLPTLTFSGFLSGLIVDGLIVIAAVAVAVCAVSLKIRINNQRAQLQANAESAWYNYQDADSVDKTKAWKDYKRARFKYNLLALATGGTTLSLGLYDEGDSSLGMLNQLRELIGTNNSTTDPDNDATLNEIRSLIIG